MVGKRPHAIGAGELHPHAPVAVAQHVEHLLEAALLRSVLRQEHAHMGDREGAAHPGEHRQQLLGQPARVEEVDMPAELRAARVDPLDPLAPLCREAGIIGLDRRLVDAHAAHAELVHLGEQRVRSILVDVDHPAAAREADLPHGVEHAGIVAAVGARLHEHEALHAEMPGELHVVRQRRERRRIAQVLVDAPVRIAVGGAEHMEMRVARQWRRLEGGRRLVR